MISHGSGERMDQAITKKKKKIITDGLSAHTLQ